MQTKRINAYLIGAILMLSVLPLIASYLLLDEVLENTIALVVKTETEQVLQSYQNDLKHLKKLEPALAAHYKATFMQVSDELLIYQQPELLKGVLRDTYLTYYMILFVIVLLLSFTAAVLLNRRVALSYKTLMDSDVEKAKKLQELRYFDEWQQVAAKLAHEINNPLTPIEMMVSNLQRIHGKVDKASFADSLKDTESVVQEEVYKLKQMVNHFSQFAKLPEPVIQSCLINEYFNNFIRQYQQAWPSCVLSLTIEDELLTMAIAIDPLLINQSLINLINNAVQVNKNLKQINVVISVTLLDKKSLSVIIFNEGKSITKDKQAVIFNMYYSTQDHKENKGLGLSIVKKILLDQGADISCLLEDKGAAFQIILPLVKQNQLKIKKTFYDE
ncbi:ATP-binding protein [Thalassotalea fonticola]|uniref:histidine kinase n=1 Tax=Thalassotalea fonticola TaxID=3065649 RepID=A0ABZ0GRN3_9GAMM|nr:ATP-binding protein [Colwelliaceae bacterium S1-1]